MDPKAPLSRKHFCFTIIAANTSYSYHGCYEFLAQKVKLQAAGKRGVYDIRIAVYSKVQSKNTVASYSYRIYTIRAVVELLENSAHSITRYLRGTLARAFICLKPWARKGLVT